MSALRTAVFCVGIAAASTSATAVPTAADWPTVRPQDFGAVGDGVHNDTDAVRAAVGHCASVGGCDLVFENGVSGWFGWQFFSVCIVFIVSMALLLTASLRVDNLLVLLFLCCAHSNRHISLWASYFDVQ